MFTKILVDQNINKGSVFLNGRSPQLAPDTEKILSEESLKVLLVYFKPLKKLYKENLQLH